MAETYAARHRRPDNADPPPWLAWALVQRTATGSTHRRAAEPDDGGAR